MEIKFTVRNKNFSGVDCVAIYAEFSHVEPPPWGEIKTMQQYAELYRVDDMVVWMDPLRHGVPIHVLKTDNMDDAVEQVKEIIRKHLIEKYS